VSSKQPALLVVDDNESNRYTLTRRLKRENYANVAVAENGRQALELLRSQSFDLVLLDIMMPEMDGFDVLERMKADDTLRHVPVIMISALDEMDSVLKCIELGAVDYLPKPFKPALLKARIDACLDKKRLHDLETAYLTEIEKERQRADDLLHVILPHPVVQELKSTNVVKPRRYENVAVFFSDIVDFTSYCDDHAPEEVISQLQVLIEAFEDIAVKHGLEKIKTIGDAFMAAAGLLAAVENPVLACVRSGFEMISAARSLTPDWRIRVGIHSGPVLGGLVGRRQYSFDLWGDTVNTAARIVEQAPAGEIALSDTAWLRVRGRCRCESLGRMEIKGKGPLEMYRCIGPC
jgi:CheY-like chemotaxis protein